MTYLRLKKNLNEIVNFLALFYRRAFIHLQVEITWDFLQLKIITFVMVNLVLACSRVVIRKTIDAFQFRKIIYVYSAS